VKADADRAPSTTSPAARRRIILIGYRGSGKTTVGRALARRLACAFVDTDEAVEKQAGRSVSQIFDAEGESAFRAREAAALQQALGGTAMVVSVGGGAVKSERNRELMKAAGDCVWLRAAPHELLRRLQADERSAALRPALTPASPSVELAQVLAERTPLYEALAQFAVETDGRGIDTIVEEILARAGGGAHGTPPADRG